MKKYLLFTVAVLFAIVGFAASFDCSALLHPAILVGHLLTGHGIVGGLSLASAGIISVDRQRFCYYNVSFIAKKLQQYGQGTFIVNKDYFRSEEQIQNGTTQYKFVTYQKTMDSEATAWPLQHGVQDKDLFVGISMGFYLDNRKQINAGTGIGTSQVSLQTYPSYQAFQPNMAANALQSLYAFFNGNLSFTVDRTNYVPQIPTVGFLYKPQTQSSSAQNENEFSIGQYSRMMDPYLLLSGQNTNLITLNVNNDDDGTFLPAGTGTTINVATVWMDGYTVQSGADYIAAFSDFHSWLLQNHSTLGDVAKADAASVAAGGTVSAPPTTPANAVANTGGMQTIASSLATLK